MKKILLGAAAALAIAAPGVANANAIGSVGIAYGPMDQSDDGTKEDMLSLEANFATEMGHHQFQLGAASFDMDHSGHSHNYGALEGHLGHSRDTHAFGVFAGALQLSGDVAYGVGVEGAFYFGNFTVGGDISYASTRGDPAFDIASAAVNGAYYFAPNLALTGEVGYIDSEWMGTESANWALGLEYLFAGMPISVSGDYIATDADYDFGGGTSDTNVWQLGATYHFGGPDLMSRDRAGASQGGFVDVARYHTLLD
jgi:hypothetical protein